MDFFDSDTHRRWNMTTEFALGLAQRAIETMLYTALPTLMISLIVGIVISLFQAVTQIQETTLAFVPKIIVTFLSILIFGPWMVEKMLGLTREIFHNFPSWIR
jgi:flagellar biosynthetic protein FliQ